MKKLLLSFVMVFMAVSMFAQEQEEPIVRIPSGYQGFLEESNSWHFDKNMPTTIQLSTTHGFYFNGHIYAGLGIGFEFNSDYFLMPFYTNIRYVFINNKTVSPFFGLRLGSFVSDNMGAYGDLAFGVRFASKKDFAVSIMVAGTYYDKINRSYYDEWYDDQGNWHQELVERNINPSGITLRIGIEW